MKIRCLGNDVDGKIEVCYFIYNGKWGDIELERHQSQHDEEVWSGYEEMNNA